MSLYYGRGSFAVHAVILVTLFSGRLLLQDLVESLLILSVLLNLFVSLVSILKSEVGRLVNVVRETVIMRNL